MPAPGSNMRLRGHEKIKFRLLEALNILPNVRLGVRQDGDNGTSSTRLAQLMTKSGVPANNTAADAPTGLGDICWDSTNDKVYRCTAYTNSTTFTWTLLN